MATPRAIVLTALAMLPLAANSWLCRAALRDTGIDAASFTSIRLIAGALLMIGASVSWGVYSVRG